MGPAGCPPGTNVGSGACAPLSQTLFVDHSTSAPLARQDGGICTPYATIQQALDAIGVPADATDQGRNFNVLCAPGTYTEDLTVPARRRIAILAFGNLGIVVSGDVSWTSPLGATSDVPVLALFLDLTGDLVLDDGGTAALNLFLVSGDVGGNVDGTAHTTGLLFGVFQGGGSVAGTTDAATLFALVDGFTFSGILDVASVEGAHLSRFEAAVVVASGPSGLATIGGFVGCDLRAAFTGPAGALVADGVTQFFVEQNDVLRIGASPQVTRLDDPMLRVARAVNLAVGSFTVDFPIRVVFVSVPDVANAVLLPNTAGVSPKRGDLVTVTDVSGTAGVIPIIVSGNGNLINGVALTTVAGAFASRSFRFDGTQWRNA